MNKAREKGGLATELWPNHVWNTVDPKGKMTKNNQKQKEPQTTQTTREEPKLNKNNFTENNQMNKKQQKK